jgi:Histidine kinase-, DNA gyrase B-, and HSP90-like ATPase
LSYPHKHINFDFVMQLKSLAFSGSANITSESIKKRFKKHETWQSIAELVWNGLDATASRIDISVKENSLHGAEAVSVLDNGTGIDFRNIENNFGRFDDTTKNNVSQRGSNGRGRLSFHLIASEATWYTRFKGENASISIDSSNIKDYKGDYLDDTTQHLNLLNLGSGTYVELKGFEYKRKLPNETRLIQNLTLEFGWFLALHKNRKIYLNGVEIPVPDHHIQKFSASIRNKEFDIGIIRWEKKPSSEKSYNYLLNTKEQIVHKQLSSFNNKPNFYITAYALSQWADNFQSGEANLFVDVDKATQSSIWKDFSEYLSRRIQEVYEDFLRDYVDEQISKFESDGVFPSYKGENEEYAKWKRGNTKKLIKTIYCADPTLFNSLTKKQAIIIIRLLDKLMISNENDGLFEVLESVIDLDSVYLKSLSEQLQRTKLENIISTIEILQKRESVVDRLREVMENHYKEVLETPDLQRIIEGNTWLFGPQYSILGAEEDDFHSISKNVRDAIPEIDVIKDEDMEELSEIEGVRRQVDLFLARKIPCLNSIGKKYYRCVIIEIKRPGLSLNDKHLRQLEDYARILSQCKNFKSDLMKFELILVGRSVSKNSFLIESSLNDNIDKGEPGLVSSGNKKFKMYVKNWYTIFDEFSLSNDYLLEHLKTQREQLSGKTREELISSLQEPTL